MLFLGVFSCFYRVCIMQMQIAATNLFCNRPFLHVICISCLVAALADVKDCYSARSRMRADDRTDIIGIDVFDLIAALNFLF